MGGTRGTSLPERNGKSMAKVLLYNFTDEKRRQTVKALLLRFAIPCREVRPLEQFYPLETLLETNDLPAPEGGPEKNKPFSDEMLVMHALSPAQFNGLLDGMRLAGVRVPLKAVVTPHNVRWSSRRLYGELRIEQEALRAGGGAK